MQKLPSLAIELLTIFGSFLAYNFGLDIKAMAIKKNSFGSGLVTSFGMMGIKDAFAPVVPFMRVPALLAIGELTKKAIVRDDKIVIAPVVSFNFTIDHRFIDGGKAKCLVPVIDLVT